MRKCPKCEYPLPDAAGFCEHCGTELATSAAPTPAPAAIEPVKPDTVERKVRADLQGLADLSQQGLMDDTLPPPSPPHTTHATVGPVTAGARAASAAQSPAAAPNQCEDLHIQYNSARVFVEGMLLPFDFQITPRKDGITDLCIEIRCGDYARVSEQPPEEPARDLTMPVHLAFRAPPGLPGGRYPFEIYVGYRKEGKQAWFVARQVHTMHSAGEKAGQAIENVRIDIQNTIDQGHAGDIQLNHNLADCLGRLNTNGFDQSVEQLARVNLPPVWSTLALLRCRKQSWQERFFMSQRQSQPPAEACRTRLTLADRQHKWHLLSETSYQLGRNRDNCDIVTRFGGGLYDYSAGISKYHCRIERAGNNWRVLDGGYNPTRRELLPSSIGTYLDGERIDLERGAPLQPGHEYRLTLGSAISGSGPVFEIRLEVLSWEDIQPDERLLLDETGRYTQIPPALILHSPHLPDDVFALIWQILPARRLDPRLAAGCFVRRTEAFQVRETGTEGAWLTPGKEARLADRTFHVSDYDQTIPCRPRRKPRKET